MASQRKYDDKGDKWIRTKYEDPFIFKNAEDFFEDLDSESTTKRPTSIALNQSDQFLKDGKPHPACSHGAILRMNDDSLLLVQFMRPKVWRIRFDPNNRIPDDFTDYNTRTIIQDTLTTTIQKLDVYEGLDWRVQVDQNESQIVFHTITTLNGQSEIGLQLIVQKNPIRIEVVRMCTTVTSASAPPKVLNIDSLAFLTGFASAEQVGKVRATIWRTPENPLQYNQYATCLKVEKLSPEAQYCGFGEQGGSRFFKYETYMNYFNFDNMRYFNIYNKGPKWDAEPLYHSDPYWIELNANRGLRSQTSTFIDNYSQICVDLTKSDPNVIRIATRFNSFHGLFFAGDDVQDLINSFTSIVGRPRLKPRYILGNHQGCYGYNTKQKVLDSANSYWDSDIPLDGMHVDVDIQDNYRTFSVDQQKFPEVKDMFTYLREQRGLKCSTNITPFINRDPADWYGTLNEALEKGYFVMDERDTDPSVPDSDYVRYQIFGKGDRYFKNPSSLYDKNRPDYGDDYNFREHFNKNGPFHGGVSYGGTKGRPGHYPDLNREVVRKWWADQYNYLFDQGLEFVWQDMTSPCMAEQYGDMKSWPFRLLLNADGWSGDAQLESKKKKAIEIWSLYSYNLHKATYQGLNNMKQRKGKRNFIIGRGSFTGAHRFAGLWTGDNSSTWAFFDISVAQVLSLGLSGVSIAGADVGGFEAPSDGDDTQGTGWADPELLIRWYGAYSLLPWFRNHYTKYDPKGGKYFQEPWAYKQFIEGHGQYEVSAEYHPVYKAVYPSCRYTIRLRYSLLQLLYDAMFENMLNGLPLARAMIITDTMDATLFGENAIYTRSQYLVRNDLLVAPVLIPHKVRALRKLYLPFPNNWYAMNIRPYDSTSINDFGAALTAPVAGGTKVEWDARISSDEAQVPYQTPMYIREGGIIPQIEVRKFVPDREGAHASAPANPVTIHVYPGRDNTYDMFLDDGVSRASAPTSTFLAERNHNIMITESNSNLIRGSFGDAEAANQFTNFRFAQTTSTAEPGVLERRVTISCPYIGYDWAKVIRDIGDRFRVIFWHEPSAKDVKAATFDGTSTGFAVYEQDRHATVAWVPVQLADKDSKFVISVKHS